jgi:hypothetical protein
MCGENLNIENINKAGKLPCSAPCASPCSPHDEKLRIKIKKWKLFLKQCEKSLNYLVL